AAVRCTSVAPFLVNGHRRNRHPGSARFRADQRSSSFGCGLGTRTATAVAGVAGTLSTVESLSKTRGLVRRLNVLIATGSIQRKDRHEKADRARVRIAGWRDAGAGRQG